MKLIVTGYGRHGKDTFCEYLRDKYNFNFQSSSFFMSTFVFEKLKDKYNYQSEKECYEDRHNHRKEWFDIITETNTPDKSNLGCKLFEKYDIYCGLRNIDELKAIRKKIKCLVIWIEACDRIKYKESEDSLTIKKEDCDIIILNNGTKEELYEKIDTLFLLR